MFSELFDMPEMHLFRDDPALQTFYDAMCERPSTRKILASKRWNWMYEEELYGGLVAYLDKHIDRRILEGYSGVKSDPYMPDHLNMVCIYCTF
jgi:hypothetical protein